MNNPHIESLLRNVHQNSTRHVASHSSQTNFRPGDHPDDHRYLFEGHRELLTDMELRAWSRIITQRKVDATKNPTQREMMRRSWLKPDDSVTTLLMQGEESFFLATLDRILREHPESLRTCPRCGSLCRTSRACLCPHCSNTWFDEKAVTTSTPES